MNYRHAFHAGNFADVHKHAVLARILVHLCAKPAPFRVIDTHAGAGRYDLLGQEASRSGEWRNGIERVWLALRQDSALQNSALQDSASQDSAPPRPSEEAPAIAPLAPPADARVKALLAPYLDAVAALNAVPALHAYPGSPLIARHLLRPHDRLVACELEPGSAAALQAVLRGDRRAKALMLDGWIALNAYVPPKERRGVVLVDPPFEDPAEFGRLAQAFAAAHRKWPTGTYLLWYPIKQRDAPDALARRLQRLAVPKVLRCELMLGEPGADAGLAGSGLIVVNPPFPLEADLRLMLPALGRILAPRCAHRLDWLAGESSAPPPVGGRAHFSTTRN